MTHLDQAMDVDKEKATVQAVNLMSAVEELNGLTSQELNKLLRESENFTIHYVAKTGSLIQIDMERFASSLPLHLIAVIVSSSEKDITMTCLGEDGMPLIYILRGLRLLHLLADIASRHMRFEQIVLEDLRVSEQILDLVFYALLILARHAQDNHPRLSLSILHSALVACSLHLLTSCISSQWQDLVHVLLAHPKVDIFMDVSFDAIHVDVKFLNIIISSINSDVLNEKFNLSTAERIANNICQHCEASLQLILSLCQQKLFRDRVLKNKELCKNGGILSLAQTILDLNIQPGLKDSYEIVASVSRLKSKVLSILLQLCEAENISYLDEVAGCPKSMNLAKCVVLKILDLLRDALGKEVKQLSDSLDKRKPMGLVLLNSMRLADIFSDDSNFRSFFMANIISVLAEILAMPQEKFLSNWCSTDAPIVEEDAVLDYDPYMASGAALACLCIDSQITSPASIHKDDAGSTAGSLSGIPQASYAQQRTSYLVKIIANLHCFVPSLCEEQEKDLFLNKFRDYLRVDASKLFSSSSQYNLPKTAVICTNLCSLSIHARSLIPNFLNEEDVDLLSKFYKQLLEVIPSQSTDNFIHDHSAYNAQDLPNANLRDSQVLKLESRERATFPYTNFSPNHQDVTSQGQDQNLDDCGDKNGVSQPSGYHETDLFDPVHNPKADLVTKSDQTGRNLLESFEGTSEANTSRGSADAIEELSEIADSMKEIELLKAGPDLEAMAVEEKLPRKRKRNIMNDKQIILIENALLEEPEMHRNTTLLQQWADKLSLHGSELTSSQLKNWLNNRKARLARVAREARAPSEGETAYPDKSCGSSISHYYDSPESGGEESYIPVTSRGGNNQGISRCSSSIEKKDHDKMNLTDSVDFTTQQGIQGQHSMMELVPFEVGQSVSFIDAEGKWVGTGQVYQVEGRWHGKSLEESGTCIISVTELNVDKSADVQHPSEAAGATFEEAEIKNNGVMRVAWDANKILRR